MRDGIFVLRRYCRPIPPSSASPPVLTLDQRVTSLVRLGEHLSGPEDELLTAYMKRTEFNNGWFTLKHQRQSLTAIRDSFLNEDRLWNWIAAYSIPTGAPASPPDKTVGLVMAGNIPLVGFHDLLCVYVSGHRARIKLSQKDPYVLPYLLQLLERMAPGAEEYFDVVEQLSGFDAVIATGSNNSARYFEAYFGKYPHIIRKNRTGVAVLTGEETGEQLGGLGRDTFDYYGLGCRNVSKLFVPRGYDFEPLLDALHEWRNYQTHVKWKNNFDYNYALLTLNKEPFYFNGATIIRESTETFSPIATLFFEYYDTPAGLAERLTSLADVTQLVVGALALPSIPIQPFGTAQRPALAAYADGVDTLRFLTGL